MLQRLQFVYFLTTECGIFIIFGKRIKQSVSRYTTSQIFSICYRVIFTVRPNQARKLFTVIKKSRSDSYSKKIEIARVFVLVLYNESVTARERWNLHIAIKCRSQRSIRYCNTFAGTSSIRHDDEEHLRPMTRIQIRFTTARSLQSSTVCGLLSAITRSFMALLDL